MALSPRERVAEGRGRAILPRRPRVRLRITPMRSLVAFLVLLVSLPAAAQQAADLSVEVENFYNRRVQIGTPLYYYVTIKNNGPGVAENVKVTVTPPPQSKKTRINDLVNCVNFECAIGN